jgi:penicillin-binding protein 1A
MHDLGYITDKQYETAKAEQLKVKTDSSEFGVHAEYVSEMARQLVYEQFKEDTYTRGLNVFTTITKADQDAAYLALRKGVMDYEKRHAYRGPEAYIDIPQSKEEADDAIETELADHPDSDDIIAAMVLQATPQQIIGRHRDRRGNQDRRRRPGVRPLLAVRQGCAEQAHPPRRGDPRHPGRQARLGASPRCRSRIGLVAVSTDDGAIQGLVGGFDYNRNKFNHVTQAWRQPGSSFKPFIYSASLERGLSPATIINDAPISFDAGQTGGQAWEPKNYDGKYDGPMTMRGPDQVKNMISIRILNKIGAKYGQEYATRFGFDADKNPPYLTLALGAAQRHAAADGRRLRGVCQRRLQGQPLPDFQGDRCRRQDPVASQSGAAGVDANRVIDERNAFLMDSMLKDVVRFGTATKALVLKRPDISGKTGTTNDSIDAWFAGYQPNLVGIAWIGYDQPKNLGNRETGGGLALPIWIGFMQKALKNIPIEERAVPEGVMLVGDEYYYSENPPGAGVHNLDGPSHGTPAEEKAKDAVKNELF